MVVGRVVDWVVSLEQALHVLKQELATRGSLQVPASRIESHNTSS